jgi:hypothetical protein
MLGQGAQRLDQPARGLVVVSHRQGGFDAAVVG